MATKYVQLGFADTDSLAARKLSRLVSSVKTLRSVRKNPDQLTEAGSTLIHDYEERFLSAYLAAADYAKPGTRLSSQVDALTELYEEIIARRR